MKERILSRMNWRGRLNASGDQRDHRPRRAQAVAHDHERSEEHHTQADSGQVRIHVRRRDSLAAHDRGGLPRYRNSG